MITYNHQDYIEQAVESVLMQTTTFPVRLYIGEDCSTDGTRARCVALKSKYPDRIELVLQERNVGSARNARDILERIATSSAKYVAMIEGDDYWTDSSKLETQVGFLEQHPDFALCFHDSRSINTRNGQNTESLMLGKLAKDVFEAEDILERWFIPSASMVFRNYPIELPEWFTEVQSGDIVLQNLLCLRGKFKYIDRVMSVYRIHDGGVSNTYDAYKHFMTLCFIFYNFNIMTKRRYAAVVEKRIMGHIEDYMMPAHAITRTREYRLGAALLGPLRWIQQAYTKARSTRRRSRGTES